MDVCKLKSQVEAKAPFAKGNKDTEVMIGSKQDTMVTVEKV